MRSSIRLSCFAVAVVSALALTDSLAQSRQLSAPAPPPFLGPTATCRDFNSLNRESGSLSNDGMPRELLLKLLASPAARGVWQAIQQPLSRPIKTTVNYCIRANILNLGKDGLSGGTTVSLRDANGNAVAGLTKVLSPPPLDAGKSASLNEAWCAFGLVAASPPNLFIVAHPAPGQHWDPPAADPKCPVKFDPVLPESTNLENALGLPSVQQRPAARKQ